MLKVLLFERNKYKIIAVKFLLCLFIYTGTMEETPQIKLKEEKIDSFDTEPHSPPSAPSSFSPVMDMAAAAAASSPTCNSPAQRASPPSSSPSFMPVVIKEEPQSPVHISLEVDLLDNTTHFAHSTTPELPVTAAAAASPPGNMIRASCYSHCRTLFTDFLTFCLNKSIRMQQ